MKCDFCSGLARFTCNFQLRCRNTLLVGLLEHLSVAHDLEIEPVGERVDNRNADAMQTAGNFVCVGVEFSARVQHRHDDFGGGLLLGRVHVHGNAAAIVEDSYGIVFVDGDVDLIAVAGESFVHGIVHNFPDKMVQSELARGTDVHRGALAHGFYAAEDFNGRSVVRVSRALGGRGFLISHIRTSPQLRAGEGCRWEEIDSSLAHWPSHCVPGSKGIHCFIPSHSGMPEGRGEDSFSRGESFRLRCRERPGVARFSSGRRLILDELRYVRVLAWSSKWPVSNS